MTQNPPEQFQTTVADALKHYNDPLWLGQHSPLATPYFLGPLLREMTQPESILGRGEGLRVAISRAADGMWPGERPQSKRSLLALVEKERAREPYGPRYLFLLLDLRYLRRYFLSNSAPQTVGAMIDLLNVSATRFFVHLQKARNSLAAQLLRVTRPGLRLEHPFAPELVGRDELLAQCAADLRSGRSLTLSGAAGIGKTSLGANLARAWGSQKTFWHTFRPGLNDDLTSVVFALAHFLHLGGCSSLWLQLMAGDGALEGLAQIVGFLREDLACGAEEPLLLCFDEVDLLHTERTQPRHGAHKQILELLEGLRGLAPLLLMGQRALIDTEAHHVLWPLTVEDTRALLRKAGVSAPEGVRRVQRMTGGNPRFLEIYIALRSSAGEDEVLDLGAAPSLRPLFNRLWKRLEEGERQVFTALSVFRSTAPVDAWQEKAGLERLRRRNLLKFDDDGGVALLPLFRELVYEELAQEQRQQLHERAAGLRAQRGQITEAAHHLWQAGQLATAVDLWYENQAIEIAQGKAGAAYALFAVERPAGLAEAPAKRLKVIRDRLSLLHGETAGILEDIDSYSWHLDERITAEALELWGQARVMRGDIDGALADFDSAIGVLRDLSTEIVLLQRRRGQMNMARTRMDLAEGDTALAEFEFLFLKGLLAFFRGDFLAARAHFLDARRLAEAAEDGKRMAQSDQFLAMAAGNHGDLALARRHAQEAMVAFRALGDRLSLENLKAELAGFYLNAREFEAALAPLLESLRFFENTGHEPRVAHISSNLAEAYLETGEIELAEQYAQRAIQMEFPWVLPYACYTLAQVREVQGREREAEQVFQIGIEAAERTENDFIAAYLYRAFGAFLCRNRRQDEGLQRLTAASDVFRRLAMPAEVEETKSVSASCMS